MSLLHFFKILLKNLKWLVLVPLVLALSVYYFTKNEKKVFSSESVVYTGIASGYSLNGDTKADYFATSNAFDNLLTLILSRETKQQVAIDLLSEQLFLTKDDPALLSWASFDQLNKLVPESVRAKLVKPTLQETIAAIKDYMQSSDDNLVYKIINSDNPFYSVNALQNIKAVRVSSSDLIKISYETNDAAICKNTLDLLIQTFMEKHRMLKEGQTESVITYFEKETHNAYKRLDSIEDIFLDFNRRNDIINYYEQTKAVAGEKENLYAQNHNLEMDKMANSSSLTQVNDNIKGRIYQILYGTDIIKDREKLSDVYGKIALNDVIDKNEDQSQSKQVDSLKSISAAIENNLHETLTKLYTESNTPNGIPTKQVLDEWLKTSLNFEQSKARLTVMDKRKKEFAEEYKKFAPLGAMLKKIERQITVAEQEYLELLHGLSLAKLAQQNNELTSKLTIVDPPYLPLKPNASKRTMQIIIGLVAGLILVLAFILANSLINKTVQQPEKAVRLLNIPLLGIYPLLNSDTEFLKKANLRLLQQLLSKVNTKEKPIVIGMISAQKGEGKSTIINMWYNELTRLNYKAVKYNWDKENLIQYPADTNFVLLEFPELDKMIIVPGMLPELHHVFLICRANRIWSKIDKELLSMFSKNVEAAPLAILNGVDTDFAEEYIGEIQKKRNFIRSFINRNARFQFGNKKQFAKRAV